jgi:DNA (cytosine-5)-methyltransferase 1
MIAPRMVDLFCKAGGAAVGYQRAGFEVVGVDIEPQPNYPFEFHQADALTFPLNGFDVVHASPPCQGYSTQTQVRANHPRLIEPLREHLRRTGLPYIIENVEGARRYLLEPIRLCGSSFGLDLRRHRYFETNWGLVGKPCDHTWQTPRFRSLQISRVRAGLLSPVVGVHGHLNYRGEFPLRCAAMGISWMTNGELVEAIPPAYTTFIGEQLQQMLGNPR